jgi:hypothetical protein
MKMIQLRIPKQIIYSTIKRLIKENLIFSVYPQNDGSYYIETDVYEDTNLVGLWEYSTRK